MNLRTIQRRILCSTNVIYDVFSYFQSFKSYYGLNVLIKVWIVKILLNFKGKLVGNQHGKLYERTYHSKDNWRLFCRTFNRSKVMIV